MVFHVLNRGVGRRKIFYKDRDYAAFERVLESTLERVPMRLLAYCLMPNHWHLLLWPREDGQLAAFMQRLTVTHVRRWQEHYHEGGSGHLYQGRFKSFPVQEDGHFLTVARYAERNALRAGRVEKTEDWKWSSLWRREKGSAQERGILSEWPVARPRDWVERVNRPQTEEELEAIRLSVSRGRPFGSEPWQHRTARALGLESCYRERGRPKKVVET
jgi:putative transposase